MPNVDHYAIVVGLTHYPTLGEPPEPPADLKGPGNDADAVAAWLTSANGGDLPSGNVTIVKSPDLPPPPPPPPPFGQPSRDEIERAFIKLEDISRENVDKGLGRRIGRRLYVYMSGHGFSPKRNQGCLFAANATARFGYHVYPSSWVEWFQDAAYFDEFVLWMDCCMNRFSTLPLALAPAQPLTSPSPAGPAFIAFAAQRPLKAVERKFSEDNDKVRGVFTWTLLEGLQGAAADRYGMVTGRSLADWMRNAQKPRMDQRDLADPDVAQEPEISSEDAGIIFRRGIAFKLYDVNLSFAPAAQGHQVRLWSGRPAKAETFQIDGGTKTLSLRPGLYVVDVPDAGLRQGFEITGPASVTVSATGNPVRDISSGIFALEIAPGNSPTEIFLVDEQFGLVDRNAGSLSARLPFGIYKVKTRLGRMTNEQIVMLDGDITPTLQPPKPVASAAPLPNTRATHDDHTQAAVQSVDRIHLSAGAGARLSVMARAWSETGQTQSDVLPWADVRIVNARGKVIADLNHDGERHPEGDPFAVCSMSVEPGTYFLRHQMEGEAEVEQSLIVPKDWFLHVYLLRLCKQDGGGFKPSRRMSFIMQPVPGAGQQAVALPDQFLTTLETARVALADERLILDEDLERLLLAKFNNPIAGIIGSHLLLIEKERDPARDIRVLNEVVTNLRGLVGREHPDVEALSLRCTDEGLRCVKPIKSPPMFQRSWTLLVEASQKRPSLLPRGLWDRVQAHTSLPPYFIWSADEQSKEAARAALVNSALGLMVPALRQLLQVPQPVADVVLATAQKAASTPKFRKLTEQVLASTTQNAARLEIPPSALKDVGQDIIKKLKG
jgi:hypothetical protein